MANERHPAVEITGLEQRSAWLRRDNPPVEQLRTDLWSIPVPVPNSPLRYVSVYVLAGDSGLTLIDAGWDSDASWQALRAGLTGIGASISDVRACLVTHRHADHIGLSHRVKQASGAWIGLHPADRDAIADPVFRDPELAAQADARWLLSLGAPQGEALRLSGRRHDVDSTFALPDRSIEDGQLLDLQGWSVRAVHTPGHTAGHLCFHDERTGMLFAGDHVLPRITPNISVDRRGDADALGDFLRSLDRVAVMDVDEVLPAHEWRFRGLAERVRELHAHHRTRLDEVLKVLHDNPGSVPWDLAGHLTWSRPWSGITGRIRLSAVLETAAHLVHLCRLGRATSTAEPAPRYTAAPARP